MGYYVKSLPSKKSEPKWKVQYVSFKKQDVINSLAKKPKKTWDITKDRWTGLGFYKYMTLEEAKSRANQLNTQLHVRRQEERIKELEDKNRAFQKRFDSVFPDEFLVEFERRFIKVRDNDVDSGRRRTSRARVVWKAAQKMIVAIGLDPSDWFYSLYDIYDYFYSVGYSIRYASSVLKFANLWGFYFCKKTGRAFLPIPFPRGYERSRLIEAYYEKSNTKRKPSKPLEPQNLYSAKGRMKEEQFNWLYLTVWFGLRPKEVDNCKDDSLWKIEEHNDRKILWVYQTKIIALPPDDRWKPIPIIFDEQEFALRILKEQNFSRPLVKTIHRYFGEGIDCYGGRKGFADLMLSKGQSIENISIWMGHSTMDRTWRSYKQRKKFHLMKY